MISSSPVISVWVFLSRYWFNCVRGQHMEGECLLLWTARASDPNVANPSHLFGCSWLGDNAKSPDRLRAAVLIETSSWLMSFCTLCCHLHPSWPYSIALSISIYHVVQISHITFGYPLSSASSESQNVHPSPGWMQQMVPDLSILAGPECRERRGAVTSFWLTHEGLSSLMGIKH